MRRWLSLFRPLFLILLTLQVSSAHALPAGVHLNLCLGYDGHLDISSDICAGEPIQSAQHPETFPPGSDHHGGCLDVALGCSPAEELRPTITKVRAAKVKLQRGDSLPPPATHLDFFSPLPVQASLSTPSHPNGISPSQHLVILRTTVLLI